MRFRFFFHSVLLSQSPSCNPVTLESFINFFHPCFLRSTSALFLLLSTPERCFLILFRPILFRCSNHRSCFVSTNYKIGLILIIVICGGYLRIYWISIRGQPTRSGPPAWGFGLRLTTAHCKNKGVQKRHTGPRNWTDNLERPWQRKMGLRFETWNVRSLYRAGALCLGTSEQDRCRMDLVGVQEVRWEGSGTLESGNYTLFYGEGNVFRWNSE